MPRPDGQGHDADNVIATHEEISALHNLKRHNSIGPIHHSHNFIFLHHHQQQQQIFTN
jgi:hypothetical protein